MTAQLRADADDPGSDDDEPEPSPIDRISDQFHAGLAELLSPSFLPRSVNVINGR